MNLTITKLLGVLTPHLRVQDVLEFHHDHLQISVLKSKSVTAKDVVVCTTVAVTGSSSVLALSPPPEIESS